MHGRRRSPAEGARGGYRGEMAQTICCGYLSLKKCTLDSHDKLADQDPGPQLLQVESSGPGS